MTDLMQNAVKALKDACDAGVTAENATVLGTKAVAFLAMVEIGRKALNGEASTDGKESASKYFTMVKKRLVNDKTAIYRDSKALWIEHVKGKKVDGGERAKGVNAYLKACTGMKLIGTVQDVQTFANKVVKQIAENYGEDCRNLAREFPSEEARADAFTLFWTDKVKADTYATLKKFVTGETKAAADAFDSMVKRIEKIQDVAMLTHLAEIIAAQIEVAKANRDRIDAVAGTIGEDGSNDDDMVVDNVVSLRAA